MDRPLRQLGQLLVVMAALLGAVLGVGLALIVDNADTSGTVAASGPERAAALAASPPSSRPAVPRETNSEGAAAGNGTSIGPRADAADQRDGKADSNRNGRHNKPGKGKDKPDKGKGKSK